MPRPRLAALITAVAAFFAAATVAQQPADAKPDPVALVSQAEKLLKKKDKELEDAILLLWQALDQLAKLPANAVHDATTLSARFLLQENDPREAERRRVFTSVAKQQVELATAYRTKKWLQIAATRLAVADAYDRDAGSKERAALEAARPKDKPAEPAATKPPAPKPSPLLQRDYAQFASGSWTPSGDGLVTGDLAKQPPVLEEWITKTPHEDHDVIVEVKPVAAGKRWNAAVVVGQHRRDGDGHFSGWRCYYSFDPEHKDGLLHIWEISGMQVKMLANSVVPVRTTPDGYHRLSVQVSGTGLRFQYDDTPALMTAASTQVRGVVGLMHGLEDVESCGVTFRNFRIEPLPADAPSDEELRAEAAAATQSAIGKAVERAKDLLQKKQAEEASLQLRDAMQLVDELPEGVLRDNLRKSIDAMLVQADPLAPKRRKTAQTIAGELAALADTYATAGMVRAALAIQDHAAAFDPEGQAPRTTALREKVVQWNVAQAAARASELQPPNDDGTQLREWFAKGRRLDTYALGLTLDGAEARASLPPDLTATWIPEDKKAVAKASVFVHLPKAGSNAGLLFDVVDVTQFGLLLVSRHSKGLRVGVWAKLAGKWVPVLHRDIAMDAWRRDGWHQIRFETTADGIVGRCLDAELKIPRKSLGKATGVMGLYASNDSKEIVDVQWRAYRVE